LQLSSFFYIKQTSATFFSDNHTVQKNCIAKSGRHFWMFFLHREMIVHKHRTNSINTETRKIYPAVLNHPQES